MNNNSFAHCIEEVRTVRPLVHCITNYVTVNDCANALLAVGASPLMSDESEEMEDIQAIADGLLINIGTLNRLSIEASLIAGKKARELDHCIVFDPVGCGASALRRSVSKRIIEEVKPHVIKGNVSEIRSLLDESQISRGVDAIDDDCITESNIEQMARFAQNASEAFDAVIGMTGAIDIVAYKDRSCAITSGDALMSCITGSGCMLGCVTAAFASAWSHDKYEATIGAFAAMGAAGKVAKARMQPIDGNATFRTYLLDALYHMNQDAVRVVGETKEIEQC